MIIIYTTYSIDILTGKSKKHKYPLYQFYLMFCIQYSVVCRMCFERVIFENLKKTYLKLIFYECFNKLNCFENKKNSANLPGEKYKKVLKEQFLARDDVRYTNA